jgi:alpha-glucosidase (family GH31 glycosyl hydrolase)
MLNHFHFLDRKRDLETRGFTFSRFSGLGSHRYPIGFSGDTQSTWDSLAFQPFFTSNASLIGYGWWSHDIGGHYHGETDAELYTRWVQYGVFSPIFRLHSSNNFYSKRAPFEYDEETEIITRHWMQFRHALIPYIYTYAYQNSLGELPLIRPMMIKEPTKKHYKNQYYFGDELIVSPVVSPRIDTLNRAKQTVWLPKGTWYDLFTGEPYIGHHSYTLYPKLEDVPIFAKAGSIIPLSNTIDSVTNPTDLKVVVFPKEEGVFTLYEDDGETVRYEQGKYVQTTFKIRHEDEEIYLEIDAPQGEQSLLPDDRKYHIHINGVNQPCKVVLEGLIDHQIRLEVKDTSIDSRIHITNALKEMKVSEDDKRKIGYVQLTPYQHQGGVLSFDMPLHQKIHKLNQMAIHQDVKDFVINELTKHTSI